MMLSFGKTISIGINISGFTSAELRSIVKKVYNLEDLKEKVKALRSDRVIKNNIDILFETYEKME